MPIPIRVLAFVAAVTLTAGCGALRGAMSAPPDPLADARTFFDSYISAIRAGQRDRIASFYSEKGAYTAYGTAANLESRETMDAIYRGPRWQPPTHFVFDTLAFHRLDDDEVLVTGRFRWVAGGADTIRVGYVGLLERTASGYGIRVESETTLPRR